MKSHVLIVADGRSPTARSWIENVQALGYDVSLISTFACEPQAGLKHFHILPIAFSRFSSNNSANNGRSPKIGLKTLVRRFSPFFQSLRYSLGPLTLLLNARTYQHLVHDFQPDLVHALRIPFEGMLGSYTPDSVPFLAATWGNDLTLHAKGSWLMGRFTRRCLERADGFTSDTLRDVHLAYEWGLRPNVPALVIPGSGGLDLDALQGAEPFNAVLYKILTTGPWVVNPRGLRPGSVHQDVFFAAIPKILAKQPGTIFICPGLGGFKQAEDWVKKFSVEKQTFLLPKLSQPQLWSLLKEAQVFVSPSSHDGTPNTLLEAMACGCFPVVGDIESLQAWVKHGENGLLVNPLDPDELAHAILTALDQSKLRQKAASQNLTLIKNRAAQKTTRPMIDEFYTQFLSKVND